MAFGGAASGTWARSGPIWEAVDTLYVDRSAHLRPLSTLVRYPRDAFVFASE